MAYAPGRVGPLDGLPSSVRDQANRAELARLRRSLRFLLAEADERAARARTPQQPWSGAAAERKRLRTTLEGLDKVHELLNPSKEGAERRLLLMIDAKRTGHAVVSVGDPDTATNVVSLVPGAMTPLKEIGLSVERADVLYAKSRERKDVPTASIAWLGYDSPPLGRGLGSARYATEAVPKLREFLYGLRVSHKNRAENSTLLGYSYGALLAGKALTRGGTPLVDNLAFLGGYGVGVNHASELNLDQKNVWATKAPNDLVKGILSPDPRKWNSGSNKWFGTDPVSRRFGARIFESDKGKDPVRAHWSYWDEGSKSLAAMASLVAGTGPERKSAAERVRIAAPWARKAGHRLGGRFGYGRSGPPVDLHGAAALRSGTAPRRAVAAGAGAGRSPSGVVTTPSTTRRARLR